MKASYIEDFQKWKQEFFFSAPVQVRFSETDMFGHVNNTVPIAYFEFARIEFMKSMGLMQRWLEAGNELFPVVADMQVDFLQQVFFDEKLEVHVKVARVGTSSADIHYWTVNEKEETCFTGRGVIVQISKQTGKGHPWSKEEMGMLRTTHLVAVKE